MRTLVDIPEDDISWLDARARSEGKSRAAVVREAVSTFRAERSDPADTSWIDEGAGYWSDRTDIGDSVEYQHAIRHDSDFVPAEHYSRTKSVR
ncbi:ribbon-helix-helix protein, CopG family [Sphingomonas sp.]|jgi:hypothetical protein|uniref:ribbon-helix-helix protein, CopG family n=1 Tax=Sphingomonas sp. TaxID=28214 RepID=UPI0035C7B639